MPGSKFLSLVLFVVTVGWAVMGQDIFGRNEIEIIGKNIIHVIVSK